MIETTFEELMKKRFHTVNSFTFEQQDKNTYHFIIVEGVLDKSDFCGIKFNHYVVPVTDIADIQKIQDFLQRLFPNKKINITKNLHRVNNSLWQLSDELFHESKVINTIGSGTDSKLLAMPISRKAQKSNRKPYSIKNGLISVNDNLITYNFCKA